MEIEKYNVFTHDSTGSLLREVNSWIAKGWDVQGGICVFTEPVGATRCNDFIYYSQAMVKYKK